MSFPIQEKTLLIRPEYLNSEGTLFGGNMMKWADEMAFNAATLAFPEASFVTRLFGEFDFKTPVGNGDIVKVHSRIESVGRTSCKVAVWCLNARTNSEVFRSFAIMVNFHNGQKCPINKPDA